MNKTVTVEVDEQKRFDIYVGGKRTNVSNLNAAIQFIVENAYNC